MRLAWVLTRGGGGGAAYATKAHDVAPYIRGRTSVLVCDLPVAAGNLLVDLRRGECADKQDNKPAESSSTFPIDEFSPGSVPLFYSLSSCKCVQKQRPPHDLPPIYLAQQQIVEPKIDAERESVEQV